MWAFIGAILGSFIALMFREGSFAVDAGTIKYEDLAAVLLSAVGVLVAVFGVILAILAFWGFNQLKADAVRVAEAAGTQEVREQVTSGPLRDYIHDEIDQIIKAELGSEAMEQRIVDRVAEIVLGSPKDRELDEEELADGE
jgi:hypothetical protein